MQLYIIYVINIFIYICKIIYIYINLCNCPLLVTYEITEEEDTAVQGYMRFSLKTRMSKEGMWEADFVVTKDGAISNSQENVITLFLNNVWGWQGAEACYTEEGTGPRGLFGFRTLFTGEKLGSR